jgi:hypothetical protein
MTRKGLKPSFFALYCVKVGGGRSFWPLLPPYITPLLLQRIKKGYPMDSPILFPVLVLYPVKQPFNFGFVLVENIGFSVY